METDEQPTVTLPSAVLSIDESLDQFLEKAENERNLTPDLDQLLNQIAKTGCFNHPWEKIKPVFLHKLIRVLDEFNVESPMDKVDAHPNVDMSTFDELKSDLIERVGAFENAPFTIQRLCELIVSPRNHYLRTDKFLRGLTKCVCVVTTIDKEGNKIYVEPSRTVFPSSPTVTQMTNGFVVPHDVNNGNSQHEMESQETQVDFSTNARIDDEMEEDEEEEEEEEENSSSPAPVVDESSSSSNSNPAAIPSSSSSTEDMLEQ